MAGLPELAAKIGADKESVEAVAGPINSSKGQAEHVLTALAGLGIEKSSARMRGVIDQIEEAESIREALQGALVKAQFIVLSAIHGKMGPSAPGSGAVVPLKRIDEQTGAPKAGLDAVPPHVRQEPTPSGDELAGVDPTIGPFQKEHEDAGADRQLNPFQRGTRRAARNVGDLRDAADQLALPTIRETGDLWQPPETYPVVGTAEPHSTYVAPPPAHTDFQGSVGNLVVMTVLVAEWAARGLKNRKGKK
ncbi:hypothetical protein [Glycomyces sp. NPDC048151]|uniref:hypothetical protein n=1 Tax=Glycomyces sp. NPDC048151 TaxID=3364002 RepID=UPI00371F3BCF